MCLEANAKVESGKIVCSAPISLLKIKGLIANPKLDVGANGITCETLHVKGQVHLFTTPVHSLLVLKLKFEWLNCTSTVPFCEGAATVTTPSELEAHIKYIEKTYSTVGQGEASVEILKPFTTVILKCLGVKTTCEYKPASITGTSLNSTHALSVVAAIPSPGGLCPEGTELASGALNMDVAGEGETGAEGANFVITS